VNPYRYRMPTEVVFGAGTLDSLGERCRPYGSRPLVVTGRRSARATGLLDRVLGQLPGAAVFDAVEENPSTATCETGASFCRERDCDFVVALGGGSPIDAAKAIAVLAKNDGRCRDYFGTDKYPNPNLPIVAVPTTAGTGSEVTPYSVLTDEEAGMKRTLAGRALFPTLAILDPETTLTLPVSVTVNTGLDVLSQAMEGMVSRTSTPVGDVLALEACRLVKEHLPRCVRNGEDREARARMLHASMLAGSVIAQSGTTLVHGMGYYFTLQFGIAHGLANGLLLTPLFQFNALHEPEKVAAIAEALGVPVEVEPTRVRRAVAQGLHALLAELGVDPAAKNAGVAGDRLEEFAREVAADPYRFRNQPGSIGESEVLRFYEQAYEGAIA
jgi:alcohol dehydrogenase class IV